MKILWWQWASYMREGVRQGLEENHYSYEEFFYQLQDWEKDDVFMEKLDMRIASGDFDLVFSINYNPLITQVCDRRGIRYVCWVYDSPLHIRNLEPMKKACNEIYLFDRGLADDLKKQGYAVSYAPLAGDVKSFGEQRITEKERGRYSSQISMVGSLYPTEYAYYMTPLSDEQKGFFDGVIAAQKQVYGGYFLPQVLTEEVMRQVNRRYRKASRGTVEVQPRELEYMLACEVTRQERLIVLSLLARHFQVALYTRDAGQTLEGVDVREAVDYYGQMPKVFALSEINLNVSLKTIRTGMPLRVFDVISSGGFLLTNYQSELEEYFDPGRELAVYSDMEEMYALAQYYLGHPKEREETARRGYQRICREYTFQKALKKIMGTR